MHLSQYDVIIISPIQKSIQADPQRRSKTTTTRNKEIKENDLILNSTPENRL